MNKKLNTIGSLILIGLGISMFWFPPFKIYAPIITIIFGLYAILISGGIKNE